VILPAWPAALSLLLATAGCAADSDAAAGAGAAAGNHRQAARPPPVAELRPEQLVGLDGDRLTMLLGPADFRRDDGPARIWQFRDPDCVLDVFLYAAAGDGDFRVEHVALRDRSLLRAADAGCVARLLRERQTRAAAATG
jgi:hypothetical protein